MVDCKICENGYCEHAGTQRGIVVECNGYKAPKKPQTNADRIRAMSDEELAELLLDGCRGAKCSEQPQNEMGSVNCFKCRVDWLRQPVKED